MSTLIKSKLECPYYYSMKQASEHIRGIIIERKREGRMSER